MRRSFCSSIQLVGLVGLPHAARGCEGAVCAQQHTWRIQSIDKPGKAIKSAAYGRASLAGREHAHHREGDDRRLHQASSCQKARQRGAAHDPRTVVGSGSAAAFAGTCWRIVAGSTSAPLRSLSRLDASDAASSSSNVTAPRARPCSGACTGEAAHCVRMGCCIRSHRDRVRVLDIGEFPAERDTPLPSESAQPK